MTQFKNVWSYLALLLSCFATLSARAQAPMGAPPPDAAALVEAPKGAADVPKVDHPGDGTTASLSAGGQEASGNSRLVAATINGTADTRWSNNGLGGSLLGNYGRGGAPGAKVATTAENLQGRIRYDRYVIEQASVFLINTGRHDRFQGIDVRYNLDPGFKYLFFNEAPTAFWAEVGYDLQYDVRRNDARMVMGTSTLLAKTATDHSGRGYVGVKHAFNPAVALSSGVEVLESLVHGSHTRVNYDVLLTATVGAGFSFGAGFGFRYDHAPLPSKHSLDTTTTLSVIYSYSSAAPAKPAVEAEKPAEPTAAPADAAPTNAAPTDETPAPAAAALPAEGAPSEAPAAAAPAVADPSAAPAAPVAPTAVPATPSAP
jgi:putative salt-induced outer membrane protein YdiY